VRYGEEIGMGENLALEGREAIRTPMQWDSSRNGGFSSADAGELARPVVTRGRYSATKVNVTDQQRDPNSLLRWFENLVHTLREAPEIGAGHCTVVDVPLPRAVLAHRFDAPSGAMLLLHNLSDKPVTIDIGALDGVDRPHDLLVDGPYAAPTKRLTGLELHGWGYRWIRLCRRNQA